MDGQQLKDAVKEAIIELSDEGEIINYKKIGEVVSEIINEELIGFEPELGDKWTGGKIIIKPGREELQSKEIPVEKFFKKIIMIRDRLRVLEQNVNSNKKLDDEEKIKLQDYITRCYGTLTTFNTLFKYKSDYFVGAGRKE
ncbi:hypothetical protein BEH94_11495 [Candidatus Altiarchaeales archaeon WOR_SM1_SCG]|nr:hypothetical protein BEH94_11495 [Candidatus Altiarchaeales archaeon WOR_SM1_SCG]